MNNIHRFRKEKNLTLKELGKMCDISESQMQRIEKGSRYPSFEVLLKLTEALDHTSDEILGFDAPFYDEKEKSADIDRLTEKQKEFIRLVSQLSDQEISMLLSQVKGLLRDR